MEEKRGSYIAKTHEVRMCVLSYTQMRLSVERR